MRGGRCGPDASSFLSLPSSKWAPTDASCSPCPPSCPGPQSCEYVPPSTPGALVCLARRASPEPRVVLGAQRVLTQGAWWEGGAEAGGGERGYIPHTRAFSATFPGLPPCAGECGGGLRVRRVRASAHTWTPRGHVQGWQSRLSPGR